MHGKGGRVTGTGDGDEDGDEDGNGDRDNGYEDELQIIRKHIQ